MKFKKADINWHMLVWILVIAILLFVLIMNAKSGKNIISQIASVFKQW